ncbi:MAG: AsmA-like C-terminal region-containing protein [Bacteroidota bacterium]
MKKSVKVLLYSLFGLILLFILLIGFVWLQQDSIKQYAIKQLNEQLSAPVSVSSIDITFIEQFPRVSLLLNDVVIQDKLRSKRNLLQAKRIFIAFNLYDILTRQYNIKLIEADSGYCHLFINEKGKANYTIVKETEAGSEDIFLSLKHISLRNINIIFEEPQAKQFYDIDAHDVLLSGNFSGKKESLSASGALTVNRLKSGIQLIKNKPIDIDIALDIDESQSLYSLSKGNIRLGSLDLKCTGTVINKAKATELNLSFHAAKLSITDLLELFPGSLANSFKEYKSEGNIYFTGLIKGKVSASTQPEINLQFGVENGTLTARGQNISLSHIQCKGEFSNGSKHNLQTSSLNLPSLTFQLGSGQMEGSLMVNDFSNPFINLKLKGSSALSDVIQFTQSQWIEKADGTLQFDIAVKGNLNNLKSKQGFLGTESQGHIVMDATDIVFKKGNKSIERIQTDFSLTGKDLSINQFKASIDKSDIVVSGTLENIVPYLLSENQQLTADITYKSDYINLEHLILPIPAAPNTKSTFALPEHISVKANVSIAELVLNHFQAYKINGIVHWKGKTIETQGIQAETMKGKVTLRGKVENTADGKFHVVSSIDCKKTDLNEMFRQCNNFGQAAITDKHIRGVLNANIDMGGEWDSKMECNLDKLYASGDIHIINGQLLNYEPLEALSKYVNVEDLRDLKFADLKNKIDISKRTIRIPSMDVNNNAMNLTISGTHTFDNFMDYHLRIKLSELLSKKRRTKTNDFNEEETADGIFLYLSMKGPADNLKFSYDKKGAREQLKENLKKEGEAAKNIWKKELGIEKDETIKEKQTDNDELEFEQE